MQKRLLSVSSDSMRIAVNALEALKTVDLKSRKAAKPSAKSKWTKRIDATSKIIVSLRKLRGDVKHLPKRVG